MNLQVTTTAGFALNEALRGGLPWLAAVDMPALLAQVANIEAGVLP